MCHGDLDELLQLVIGKRALPKNDLGHTPLDDLSIFAHTPVATRDEKVKPRGIKARWPQHRSSKRQREHRP